MVKMFQNNKDSLFLVDFLVEGQKQLHWTK